MAPQNLSQVFVANDVTDGVNGTILDGSTFLQNATPAASLVGVWNLAGATPAYLTTSMMAAAGPIQIVQTMPSGTNVIASPIIDVKDIKRIKYTKYAASTRHSVRLDAGAPTSSKAVMFRIALRNAPTAYANYYQNGTALDLSGGGYEFPLLGNFAAGRMIFNIEVAASEHAGAEATLYTQFIAKLQANKTLNALFTTTNNGPGNTLDLIARHAGVVFDWICQYSDGSGAVGTVSLNAGYASGNGNYWQALSDEKAQRAKYGNFNRMYFPTAFPEFAQSANTYEVVEIQYAHGWPSSTGIARAGELNSIKIYSKVVAAGATVADTLFLGASAANWGSTDTELLF
jgi:hypothetical protein